MQRTRKRQQLAPEARHLASLGLSPQAIAAMIGVNRSTVQRWMAAGHIADTRATRDRTDQVTDVQPIAPLSGTSPTWAAAIRSAYPLDATDATLVDLADLALTLAQDPATAPAIRLGAAGRFQSLVKQLARRIRPTPAAEERAPAPQAQAATARVDPRALLDPTTIQ